MPEGLPGDQPQICVSPGYDEAVIQSDPVNARSYHSTERRQKARRMRRRHRTADTGDLRGVAATPDRAGLDLAAAELAAPAELAAAEVPTTEELPGNAAGHEAVSVPEDRSGTDALGDPGNLAFWKNGSGEAGGFWDGGKDSPAKGDGSPGRHPFLASQPPWLIRSRKVTIAIALVIAGSEVALGLIFTHPRGRHPLASPSPADSAQTRHAPRPPATSPSSPPSPKPSLSLKHPGQVPRGLISFEDGADGWKPFFGSIRSSQTTQVAYNGSHSLLITVRSTYSAVGVENGLADLRPGDKVTFHIYSDGQNGGSVLPFAEQWNQPEDLADKVQLPSHPGWFTLTWVVPHVSEVDAIGIQVVHHGSGQLTLAIDALTWPGS
jgi:hypothetical protein